MKRTVVLDFDGVLHGYQSGWKGVAVVPDPPVPGAVKFLVDLQDAGFVVAVHSSRSRSLRGRWAMRAWLDTHIIDYFGVDRVAADDSFSAVRWPWFKPAAFLTIDDRALTFTGVFPSMDQVRGFRSWVSQIR